MVYQDIQNSKFTDPILKEVESALYYLIQRYKGFIIEEANTADKSSEFDKELGDILDRFSQLYGITIQLTESELQTIVQEFKLQVEDLKSKVQSGYFKGDKGTPFLYSDFTKEQLDFLRVKGDKGDSFKYTDFTQQQLDSLSDIHSKTEKTTLADADEFMTADSTSSFSLKKITLANIKAVLSSLFVQKDVDGNVGVGVNPNGYGKFAVKGSIVPVSPDGITVGEILASDNGKVIIGSYNIFNTNYLVFNAGGGNERMRLCSSGNLLLGISTDNGLDKLQVNGSISSSAVLKYVSGDLNNFKVLTQNIATYPSVLNQPIADHGYLEVIVYDVNAYVMQRWTSLFTGAVYVRVLVAGSWTAWVEK